MSGATNITSEKPPKIGDAAICLYCGHLMEYGIGLVLMPPSDNMLKEMAGDKDLLRAMNVVGLWKKIE